MLYKEDWEKVMKKPESLKTDKFIIKSFLGNTSDDSWKEICRIAEERNCEIIDISDENSPYFDMGPSEFLYLEKNAELVVTDSFHSCVFAILFSTPFVVFKREDNRVANMYSRIETLLNEVSNKMMLINDGETEIYDGYKKPSELRGELDQFRQTFHITHEQIVKSAGDIIATANTMENQ
mgnify:CR=1 FL=1